MTLADFKRNDSYFGVLNEYLKTPSGSALLKLVRDSDAALDLPPEFEKLLKGMDAMQMMALNHAVLVGWKACLRFIENLSRPGARANAPTEQFAYSPEVQAIDAQIAEAERQAEARRLATNPT